MKPAWLLISTCAKSKFDSLSACLAPAQKVDLIR